MNTIIILLFTAITHITANECSTREVEFGIVCVCNSTYCDTSPALEALPPGKFQIYTTSKNRLGYNSQKGDFATNKQSSSRVIKVGKKQHQTIVGFGGAFTDATGINIRSLPKEAQRKLLESYFGENGIGYSLCRVPIGGTDFSPKPYSYDDFKGDNGLAHFKLQQEDFIYKIPLIIEAKKLSRSLKLFASAWTAPPWMKTKNVWTGFSILKHEHYQTWADYTVKFFDEYKKKNINFWGVTTGNEPMNGFYSYNQSKINAMGWIPPLQAKWISQNLGPALYNSSHGDIKIIINDDSRLGVPYYVPLLLNDENSLKYIDGVGVHWYLDDEVPTDVFELIKSDKKDVFRLMTEACFFLTGPELGSWERATGYIGSIIEYLQNGFVGWIDWNMALNLTGGPTYINYLADSPIIVNSNAKEFYKQPLFYAMGHFSKFVIPESVRLDVHYNSLEKDNINSVAFLRPDNLVALIVFNNGSSTVTVEIENVGLYSNPVDFVAHSISTVLFPVNDVTDNNEIKIE